MLTKIRSIKNFSLYDKLQLNKYTTNLDQLFKRGFEAPQEIGLPGTQKSATIYHIYIDSFKEIRPSDQKHIGIGTLRGVTESLDEIKSLGVTIIWLSPPYPTPGHDGRYDISLHGEIDPRLGTKTDMLELTKEAEKRGIVIMMDIVLGHCSIEAPAFKAAISRRHHPSQQLFHFIDGKVPPTNLPSMFKGTPGSVYTYIPEIDQSYANVFSEFQPTFNLENPEVQNMHRATIKEWAKLGIKALRFDVSDHLAPDLNHHAPINQNYDPLVHSVDEAIIWQPHVIRPKESFSMLSKIAGAVLEEFSMLAVAEVNIEKEESIKEAYASRLIPLNNAFQIRLDSASSTPQSGFKAKNMKWVADRYYSTKPDNRLASMLTGNHDSPREVDVVGQVNIRLLHMLSFTFGGLVSLYNQSELGISGGWMPAEESHDPQVRAGKFNRDLARRPYPFNSLEYNGGFSKAEECYIKPLPQESTKGLSYAEADVDPKSMLNFVRTLTKAREDHPDLVTATYVPMDNQSSDDVFTFGRTGKDEAFIIILNISDNPHSIRVPRGHILLSTSMERQNEQVRRVVRIRPREGLLIQVLRLSTLQKFLFNNAQRLRFSTAK